METLAYQLENGEQVILGCQSGEQLLGVIVVTHDGRKGWLNRLAVDPAYRRQGIGITLIAAAEEHLQNQGIRVFAALIYADNRPSVATFDRAGYECNPDVLYYSKRLDSGA